MAASNIKLKTLPAVTVATAGSRQAIYSQSLFAYEVVIQSLAANTGTQYIGDETVASTNGLQLDAGGSITLSPPDAAKGVDQFDISKLYVDSSVNGAEFRISAWIRE